jgi:hypothetical protein
VIRRRTLLGAGVALAGLGMTGQASATRRDGVDWTRLRAHLTGDVVLPGEPDYAVAKQLDSD